MDILVTGATGFIGSELVARLLEETTAHLRLAVRTDPTHFEQHRVKAARIDSLAETTDWTQLVSNCDVVIHTAARVHIMNESGDALNAYRQVNVEGTLHLARQAAAAGVKRFIFISSIKVNGEETSKDHKYRPDDPAKPMDPYALSKFEAEEGLMAIGKNSGMEIVIIRPPLVYGPGVKGNFQRMMKWLQRGVPLPLGLINNKRSLVSVNNVVDLIITCITHPRAANQIFLVSDGCDVSTTDLLRKMAYAMDKPARLLPLPVWMLMWTARVMGEQQAVQRLCGSLQLDISKTCELLDWKPKHRMDDILKATSEDFFT